MLVSGLAALNFRSASEERESKVTAPSEIRLASKLLRGEIASEEFFCPLDRHPVGWPL
jgi:hypothetical protein